MMKKTIAGTHMSKSILLFMNRFHSDCLRRLGTAPRAAVALLSRTSVRLFAFVRRFFAAAY